MLDVETEYFVVAKSDDGKYSGMSNICKVKDIANQIPTGVTDGHGREYEGDSALDLPAYAEVEMLDGSLGEFLIEYHGAQVYHLQKPEEENEEVQVATDIKDTIFATSALGEWLAVNMLNHEETISLDGFNEASDSEYLSDVLLVSAY